MTAVGEYRHEVEVQEDLGEAVDGNDALGQPRERWRKLFRTRAKIEPWQGREYWQAQQVQAESTHRLKFRYRPEWRGVTAACRVLRRSHGLAYYFTELPRVVGERDEEVEVMARTQPEAKKP